MILKTLLTVQISLRFLYLHNHSYFTYNTGYLYRKYNKYRKAHDLEYNSWLIGTSDQWKFSKLHEPLDECNLRIFKITSIY